MRNSVLNSKFLSCALVVAGLLTSAASNAQSGGVTFSVEKMLQLDAKQAEQKFLDDAAKAGIIDAPDKKATAVAVAKHVPVWVVRSIFGSGGQLMADLSVDGTMHFSVSPSATVGRCTVQAIQDKCVVFASPKNKKGKDIRGVCPTSACWTGDELSAELRGRVTPTTPLPAPPVAAPAPVPVPAGSVGLPAPLPARR